VRVAGKPATMHRAAQDQPRHPVNRTSHSETANRRRPPDVPVAAVSGFQQTGVSELRYESGSSSIPMPDSRNRKDTWPTEQPRLRAVPRREVAHEDIDIALKHLQHHMDDLMALARDAAHLSRAETEKPRKSRGK
jgi:hypothetical protein